MTDSVLLASSTFVATAMLLADHCGGGEDRPRPPVPKCEMALVGHDPQTSVPIFLYLCEAAPKSSP